MALLKKQWQASGEQIYRTGFADSVMRRAAGGVGLPPSRAFGLEVVIRVTQNRARLARSYKVNSSCP